MGNIDNKMVVDYFDAVINDIIEKRAKYDHDESAEDIFKVIREILGEYVEIRIIYDEEIHIYYFDILVNEDDFNDCFGHLEEFDEIFRYSLYKGKKFIVTFN